MDYKVLRDTPGYTGYVAGVNKKISGAITSAELKRYYSNIDAEIYVNGNWIEDIASISWTINQQTLPLYGYNSYIWDDVAQGTRIISGGFIINFTGPNKVAKMIATDSPTEYSNGTANTINVGSNFEKEEEYIISNDNIAVKANAGVITTNPVHYCIWKEKFDIDIVCGEFEKKGGYPVHIILKDCYITNTSQLRSKDGDVVADQYTFIARDFVTIE